MKLSHLSPTLGTEVSGPLSATDIDDLKGLLAERLVLFFRDVSFTPELFIEFGAQFGTLLQHPEESKRMVGHPLVTPVRTDETTKVAFGESWHSDQSAEKEPTAVTILYIDRVPPHGGGDTLFANMQLAYETLSGPFRDFVEGLTAVHSPQKPVVGFLSVNNVREAKFVEHPVVIKHPVTGRPALFVSPGSTCAIPQLSWEESQGVLGVLWKHMLNPRFQIRFKWTPGTVAMWDNRGTMHHAIWDFAPETRTGMRLITKGEALLPAFPDKIRSK